MNHIDGKTFGDGDTVTLDDCTFTNCTFRGCAIVYNGGVTQWSNCQFDTCQIILGDAANRTKLVLEGFGFKIIPPQGGFEAKLTSSAIH